MGYLKKIIIRHDDSNLNSDWFLSHVEVVNQSEESKKYVFHCERWLAKKKDNGKLKRTLYEDFDHPKYLDRFLPAVKVFNSLHL